MCRPEAVQFYRIHKGWQWRNVFPTLDTYTSLAILIYFGETPQFCICINVIKKWWKNECFTNNCLWLLWNTETRHDLLRCLQLKVTRKPSLWCAPIASAFSWPLCDTYDKPRICLAWLPFNWPDFNYSSQSVWKAFPYQHILSQFKDRTLGELAPSSPANPATPRNSANSTLLWATLESSGLQRHMRRVATWSSSIETSLRRNPKRADGLDLLNLEQSIVSV